MLHQIALTFTLQLLNNPPVFRESVLCLLQTAEQDLEPILSLSKYVHQVVHSVQKAYPPPVQHAQDLHYVEGGFTQNTVLHQWLLEDSRVNFHK